jgi:hypothetical protein
MKSILICIVLLPWHVLLAQQQAASGKTWQHPGAPQGFVGDNHPPISQLQHFIAPEKINGSSYSATFYTFSDIAVFSYFDNTTIVIATPSGSTIDSLTLNADSFDTLSPGNGFYVISGSKPFAALTGDAITSFASGYFATDASGSGVSTKLDTWMMKGPPDFDPHFVLFSYGGIAQFTIKDLGTGSLLYQGSIDTTGYFDFPNVSLLQGKAIQITSDKPVSALSYTDQGFYVPSANGTFAGKLFYGFSGYTSGLENSITLTSYSDSSAIVITNLSNGDTILVDTLNHWQVKTVGVFNDIFWKVTSSGTLTAADIPFEETWERISSYYYYLAEVADSTGKNIGTSFVVPTTGCDLCVFSYADNNEVMVVQLGDTSYPYRTQPIQLKDTVLQNGGAVVVSIPAGDNVYRVQSANGVSVVEASRGTGAAFVPLNSSGVNLPDLAIAESDIRFSPDTTYQTGQSIRVNLTIHNYGTAAATNVAVVAYDGNPDLGFAPNLTNQSIPTIAAGDSANLSFSMIVPPGPQYRAIFVEVDPNNLITELNKSNNEASRYLLPNNYLNSPYAVYFSAPGALKLQSGTLSPNPFTIAANIFNTTPDSISNLKIGVSSNNGMKILSGVTDTTVASFTGSGHLNLSWNLLANKDSSGFSLLTITLMQPFVDTNIVTVGILVPDTVAPPTPRALVAQTDSSGPGRVKLTWTADSVRDIAGYKIYYSTDSTNLLAGTSAGNSPVYVPDVDSFSVTGLTNGLDYWFAISAFDFSWNESSLTQPVKIFTVTKVRQEKSIPKTFALFQNFPNPFNPTTIINYQLPSNSHVSLKIYDVLGREVATLVNEQQGAGYYGVNFDAGNLPSGVYFYRISAGKFVSVKKLVVVK